MVTELMKDIYRIEVPLPKNPMKLLNSYLIRSDGRSLVIDTGFNRPECKEALMSGLKELNVDFDRTDLFLTHLHADHSGLLFSVKTEKNRAFAEEREAKVVNMLHKDEYWDHIYEEFRKAGLKLPKEEAVATHPGVMWRPDGEIDFTYITDGQTMTVGDYNLRCIVRVIPVCMTKNGKFSLLAI